jgi:hypothetical protein
VIVLGIIALLLGWLLGSSLISTIGVILVVVGLVLWFVPIGGRTRRYY